MFSLMPWKKQRNVSPALAPTRTEHPLSLFHNEFDTVFDRWSSLFDDAWPGWGGLDLKDAEDEVVCRVDAPGFEAEDFDIRVAGGTLTVYAEHKEGGSPGGEALAERYFERAVTLPGGIDPEKVKARYRNGVLEVRLPKTEEARPRKITVKTE